MLCAFCTNMAAAFALAVVQDWYIYLRRIRLAKFSKSRRNCRRILFLFINTLHAPTYWQTNNLKRTLRPSNRKPSIRYKVYREGVCHPETQQQRGKRNIAFRDTVPALSVYFKRSFNEKMESYTKPTVTSPNFQRTTYHFLQGRKIPKGHARWS